VDVHEAPLHIHLRAMAQHALDHGCGFGGRDPLELGVYAIKGLDTFYGAQDGLLEQSVYKGVSAGTIRN
jgi:hypothetical protein